MDNGSVSEPAMEAAKIAQMRITFLCTDLNLANTFAALAKTEFGLKNRERCAIFVQKAQVVLETVRHLAAKRPLMAADNAAEIAQRCGEIESSIRRLSLAL